MISPTLISALLTTCAPRMDSRTAAAIVYRESGGSSWAVGDNTARRSYAPTSYQSAINLANSLLAKHHNIDLGLGQVNSVHLGQSNVTVESMLRPCPNLAEAQAVFNSAIVTHHGDEHAALIAYNGSGSTSSAYADAVIAAKGSPFVDSVMRSPLYAITPDVPAPAPTPKPHVPALFFTDRVQF